MTKKISQLAAATLPLVGDELIPIVQGGTTKYTTAENLQGTDNGTSISGYGIWRYSTSTTGDPGTGKMGMDSATLGAVSSLRVSELSDAGVNYLPGMSTLKVGDVILLQPVGSSTDGYRYVVNGVPVDNGSYWTVPVVYEVGIGVLPSNNSRMVVRLNPASASGGGGGGGMTNPMTTAGDIITAGTAGAAQRLAAGVNGQRLTMVSGAPAWAYDLGVTITESTTSRTAALTGLGNYIRFTNPSASTFTIPSQSSVAWPADSEIHVRRAAAGNLTLTPGSGVTLNAPSGGSLVMTDAMTVTLKRVATDVWDVIGQTVVA